MKYSPTAYAQAFVLVLREKRIPPEEALRRLHTILKNNGDLPRLHAVVGEAERMILKDEGGRKVVLESARPLADHAFQELRAAFSEKDVVESSVAPEVVAGVRITIDGEWMIDASLAGRLKKLFRN